MTEDEKLAAEAMSAVFSDAQCNALLYGMGLIRISYVNGCMDFSAVDREEFMAVAEALEWLDKNTLRETKQ